jgi:predicted glycosyltransferase
MSGKKEIRIMVCPLDWGLGHATRCIPLIRELQTAGVSVILAADGPQLNLFRSEFPFAEWIKFPGYQVRNGRKAGAGLKLVLDAPRLVYSILKEHFILKSLIRKHRIDGLISDNRYGLWNRKIRTVFITHQLNIIAPSLLKFTEPILRSSTRYFARKFDECWIPDIAGNDNLSGKLSHGHKLPGNTKYIGLLSRFDNQINDDNGTGYKIIAIVSGPEPQRTVFEEILLNQLPVEGKKCLLVRGLPGDKTISNLKENTDIVNHLDAKQLYNILITKPILISRSGYSTLMDIAFTGNKAILVPTPGQTEQEYLALVHKKEGNYYSCKQNELQLKEAIWLLERSVITSPVKPAIKYPQFIQNFLEHIGTR